MRIPMKLFHISSSVRVVVPMATTFVLLLHTTATLSDVYDHVASDRKTRLWIPPEVENVRGILILGNGAGGDVTSSATDPLLQRFAEIHDFAVIATGFWSNLRDNEIDVWEQHLDALASKSGHAELVNAPWTPIGGSNGGQMSYGFNALRPEKVIAFITSKGCCYNDRLPGEASLKTPGLLIAGEFDTQLRRDSIRGLFDDNRPRGALWSWVEQEGVGHSGWMEELEIVLPFMAEAIRVRYPADEAPSETTGVTLVDLTESDGWLVDQSTWTSGLTEISSYEDYTGDRSTAGWLLNEDMAFLYRAFSTYDKEAAFAPPATDILLGEGTTDRIPSTFDVTVDTSAVPDWSKVELFNYATKIGELQGTGEPQNSVTLPVTLPPGDVYGLSSLVADADGRDIHTTNVMASLTAEIPGPVLPQAIYGVVDNDSDSRFDDLGDRAADALLRPARSVGEFDGPNTNVVARLVAKFQLPNLPNSVNLLKRATLLFYLQDIDGTPAGPIALFHSITDNDLEVLASGYEDPSYTDTLLELVSPIDEGGRYYELDVTDLVAADYAADGNDLISAFRLQVSEAVFVEDDQSARYQFTMPGSDVNGPRLVLSFVPEPSSLFLAVLGLLALGVCGWQRRSST